MSCSKATRALVVALVLWATPVHAVTITLVVKTAAGSSNGTTAVTTGVDSSTGILIAVHCASFTSVGVITDSKSNTWTDLTDSHESTPLYSRWSYNDSSPTVGAAHTFTCTGVYPVIHVFVFTVDAGTLSFDPGKESGQATPAASALQPGAVTPNAEPAVVVSGVALWEIVTDLAVDGSFTPSGGDVVHADADNATGAAAYLIQTSAALANPNWTWTGTALGASRNAVFKAVGTGGGSTCSGRLGLLGVGCE